MSMTPWDRCGYCGKIVKLNKPLFGSMHLCVTSEEAQMIDFQRYQFQAQLQAQQQIVMRRKHLEQGTLKSGAYARDKRKR